MVAMSGGVDSSVTALLLRRAGYEVEGVTLLLRSEEALPDLVVRRVCESLGIVLHQLPARKEFIERVIAPAAREYDSGRTPNPCCECNEVLKFSLLLDFARAHGAVALATGHYARIDPTGLRRGADPAKDQSYFLYRLRREDFGSIRFPLGKMCKAEVRKLAEEAHLPVAKRPDSQDLCFAVPGEPCGDTLLRCAGMPPRPGKVVFRGRVVGAHPGIHRCTLGQRGGLNVALGIPAYVKRIDAETAAVELCTDREELASQVFCLARTNWQQTPPADGEELEVQIRYRSRPVKCRVFREERFWKVEAAEKLYAVTPGQAGVLYRGDLLVGGGVINS